MITETAPTFVELRCRSAFSFGDGTANPETLVEHAAHVGYRALGITDRADLGGIIRFAIAAEAAGIRPIVGAELRTADHPLGLLVTSRQGYHNLAALVTESRLSSERGQPLLRLEQVAERAEGLIALAGSPESSIARALLRREPLEAKRHLIRLQEIFGDRLAIEVSRHHVSGAEEALTADLIRLAQHAGIPWVVTNHPRYLDEGGRLVHDLLTALRAKVDIDTALRQGILHPNGEWRLKSPAEMADLWRGLETGLEESGRIAERCQFDLAWLSPPLPDFPTARGETTAERLRAVVYEGAAERWPDLTDRQRDQIEHELTVIGRLGFSGFFLVMWDAIRYARSQNILCQGRGSAANSTVAYLLGITAIDPIENGLLFERFLSEARVGGRTEAPDIDVDFEMHRREEVLSYIYNRYQRQHAAIACVVQRYHAPTALRDCMRALGYPADAANPLAKRLHGLDPSEGAAHLDALGKAHGLDFSNPRGQALRTAMQHMDDLPRLRSTHPGGFVISREPLGEFIPIESTNRGRTILQFDKDDLDAAGIAKFDFLGLGALTAVRLTFDAIEQRTGERLELYHIPQDDAETFRRISAADTLGTFQIESRAQIASVVQTRPETLYDLVVQVALIRPGPIQANFVHPYVRRRRGEERVRFLHPDLKPILGRTQGIPIFQEQAMAISIALGGYTPTEADELRRTMGHQRKLPRLRAALERLTDRMAQRGIKPSIAARITKDLEGFANYGFPESHAWSFALIAYATAYLKTHYPAEFLLGLLNAHPMGFYSPSTLVHDARRHGVEVRPPCIRDGQWECTLEDPETSRHPAVRIGWRMIRGLGERAQEALQHARKGGGFRSIQDLVERTGLGRAELLQIARSGALDAFEPGRQRAAWEALRAAGDRLPLAPAHRAPLATSEAGRAERILLDYHATGICVDGHPMEALRARLAKHGVRDSSELASVRDGDWIVTAGLVLVRQHPQTANGTVFLLLEDEHGMVNVIVPEPIYQTYRDIIRYSPGLVVEGNLEHNNGIINIIGRRYHALKDLQSPTRSRDFR